MKRVRRRHGKHSSLARLKLLVVAATAGAVLPAAAQQAAQSYPGHGSACRARLLARAAAVMWSGKP